MAIIEPLDLFSIFVESLAGNVEIFFILAFVGILIGAAYFNMPNVVLGSMLITFTFMMMNTEIGQGSLLTGIFLLAVVIIGITFAFDLINKFKS